MTKTTYSTRYEAIEREIVAPIKVGVIPNARAEFDIDAIADEVLGDYEQGYTCMVDEDRFWEIVASHHIADGDPKIFWDEPDDDGSQTARLLQWSDNEDGFIEIDSETIEADEEPEPYDSAEATLASRNGLHDVTSIWCH